MNKEKLEKMLSGSSKVVGSKQVLKGISEGAVRCVIVATDADAEMIDAIVAKAEMHGVAVYRVSSKRKLGEQSGVEVAAAAVGIIKAKD